MKKKILIVVADYYKDISNSLIKSAKHVLVKSSKITIVRVPGVFEIPITIVKNIKKFDGFLALGCVIQGKTPHFKFISKSSIDAIMNISIEYRKPIGNGILTCLNKKQAYIRRKKGSEAANAVLSILYQ
tara:strand:+ start:4874 stop:5260 length:387 start_codon:yes stop_codon:yes gene_type:complete